MVMKAIKGVVDFAAGVAVGAVAGAGIAYLTAPAAATICARKARTSSNRPNTPANAPASTANRSCETNFDTRWAASRHSPPRSTPPPSPPIPHSPRSHSRASEPP